MNDIFKIELKKYLKHFSGWFIVTGILFAAFMVLFIIGKQKEKEYVPSGNQSRVYGDRRVFDYGNQLSGEEEKLLEEYIHQAEKKITSDIVIVTLNESLRDFAPEYMANYSMRITPDKYVMVYADKFWEDNKFGYDQPQILDGTDRTGDGVLLVDNVYREPETNKIYTWMCTTGKCERRYTSAMVDSALDVFYNKVETDYYRACIDFVDRVVKDMGGKTVSLVPPVIPGILAAVVLLIYYISNHKKKAGSVTVTDSTYLVNGAPEFVVIEDTFITKTVSKHYNPPASSSGGGGGHHTSGGGGSHGGGGHSR